MASVLLVPRKKKKKKAWPTENPKCVDAFISTAAGVLETPPAEDFPVAVAHLKSHGNPRIKNMWLTFVSIRCRARSPIGDGLSYSPAIRLQQLQQPSFAQHGGLVETQIQTRASILPGSQCATSFPTRCLLVRQDRKHVPPSSACSVSC
ncbi:hypothetical protein CORC01_03415 [Colletotrichum orchidophilum]|uniref:Uncharacterized protein n=1 Tax=Colletotrichum orchidophilum TaxID=1209926 RepID=A0A1G4BIW8_9PEZI|nr:uncharacterized protein CORC01_03415 [Colletotrichum orchidophilum]OHF01382.1 hypothetical protein CORC01_03415 [Colletotrichum orchidophilum]